MLLISLIWLWPWSSFLPFQTVAVDDDVEVESEETLETKKLSLIELFSQMFVKENFDKNDYLQKYLVAASQTIPMSAILQVKSSRNCNRILSSRLVFLSNDLHHSEKHFYSSTQRTVASQIYNLSNTMPYYRLHLQGTRGNSNFYRWGDNKECSNGSKAGMLFCKVLCITYCIDIVNT